MGSQLFGQSPPTPQPGQGGLRFRCSGRRPPRSPTLVERPGFPFCQTEVKQVGSLCRTPGWAYLVRRSNPFGCIPCSPSTYRTRKHESLLGYYHTGFAVSVDCFGFEADYPCNLFS